MAKGYIMERLMNEALKGNDDALKELKYYAGSGDCEGQYFLAMYYAKVSGHLHHPDYHYWLEKSKKNGYIPGVGKPKLDEDYGGMPTIREIPLFEQLNLASHIWSLLSLL